MKEKIKNFLLKIKKSLCTEIKTPVYKIMLFGLIMIVLSCISFSCANFVSNSLNDMQTEQVEEIPQTESIRIDRDIKGANPTVSDYVVPSNNYSVIYVNNNLSPSEFAFDLFLFAEQFGDMLVPYGEGYIYPLYAFNEYQNEDVYVILLGLYTDYVLVQKVSINTLETINLYFYYDRRNESINTFPPLPNYIAPSDSHSTITPHSIVNALGSSLTIGYLNDKLFELFSSVPFETSSTPTLENAPIDLVEDYPLEAYPDIPSNIGHQVYNSGSGSTIYSDNSELDTFGFKLFYDTETSYVNHEHYFILDGNTFYTYEPIYKFTIKKITLVITTIWATHQIYYAFDLLESPIGFYADMSGVIGGYFHEIAIQPIIEETYSDYIHINYDFIYNMGYIRNGERVSVSSVSEYGYGALIPSNTLESNYGEKGFILDTVPQLDTGYQLIALSQMVGYSNNIIYDTMPNVYSKGQEKGENIGYSTGYNDGVETGKTLQNPINPIMDFISDGASVISNVFSFEILPNISLGTILLFPLAIALIWFVIKLFMGG